jgi:hypothetical protein
MRTTFACVACLVFCCGMPGMKYQEARAAAIQVKVGYAFNKSPATFFPNPWQGDAGVVSFAGAGTSFDAGAIRVINNGALPFTINDLVVDTFESGTIFHIWGGFLPQVVSPGQSMIFTQTGEFNFDTSDEPIHDVPASSVTPHVRLTIDGVTLPDFVDTAQVLNTEGSDHLMINNVNESHQWRDIGTFGGQAGDVPEPSSLIVFGLVAGLVNRTRRHKAHKA